MNDIKLAYLEDVVCSMKQCKLIPLHNAPENNDVGDKHDSNKLMELSEYMKNMYRTF